VRLASRLLAQFPEAMTIVLQHQFWDLVVGDTSFEVGMSFGGIPERLTVTFASIKEFVDPSVPFGVKFEQIADAAATAAPASTAPAPASEPVAEPQPASEPKPPRPAVAAVPQPASETPRSASDDDPQKPAGGGEVVSLDRFRKK